MLFRVFLVICSQNLGFDLLALPQTIHQLIDVSDVDEIGEGKCSLLAWTVQIRACYGILHYLHLGDGLDFYSEALADAKHV